MVLGRSMVHILSNYWPLLVLMVICLTGLAKLSAMRKQDKTIRQAKKQFKKDKSIMIKQIDRIIYYIDQRLNLEYDNTLANLRTEYQTMKQQIYQNSQIYPDPQVLLNEYENAFNETQSQLYNEMMNLQTSYYQLIN